MATRNQITPVIQAEADDNRAYVKENALWTAILSGAAVLFLAFWTRSNEWKAATLSNRDVLVLKGDRKVFDWDKLWANGTKEPRAWWVILVIILMIVLPGAATATAQAASSRGNDTFTKKSVEMSSLASILLWVLTGGYAVLWIATRVHKNSKEWPGIGRRKGVHTQVDDFKNYGMYAAVVLAVCALILSVVQYKKPDDDYEVSQSFIDQRTPTPAASQPSGVDDADATV